MKMFYKKLKIYINIYTYKCFEWGARAFGAPC